MLASLVDLDLRSQLFTQLTSGNADKNVSPKSSAGPRVGIPAKAVILYSGLIVIKVVGCDHRAITCIHRSQPVGSLSPMWLPHRHFNEVFIQPHILHGSDATPTEPAIYQPCTYKVHSDEKFGVKPSLLL